MAIDLQGFNDEGARARIALANQAKVLEGLAGRRGRYFEDSEAVRLARLIAGVLYTQVPSGAFAGLTVNGERLEDWGSALAPAGSSDAARIGHQLDALAI